MAIKLKKFTQNNFAKGRHRVLSPLIRVRACLAYAPHARDVGHVLVFSAL